jgi:hypothetical protein
VQSTEMLIDKEYKYEEISAKENKKPLDSKTRLGYSINISLSQIDLEMLEMIKKNLNDFGKIYVYPKRKEARLAI